MGIAGQAQARDGAAGEVMGHSVRFSPGEFTSALCPASLPFFSVGQEACPAQTWSRQGHWLGPHHFPLES